MDKIINNNNVLVYESTIKRWKEKLDNTGAIYMFAMAGTGKTMLAEVFAKNICRNWKRVSVKEKNAIEKIEKYFFENRKTRTRKVLIIDDLFMLENELQQRRLADIFEKHKNNTKFKIIILNRADIPRYLMTYVITKQIELENSNILHFDIKRIEMLIENENLAYLRPDENMHEFAKKCYEATSGLAISVKLYIDYAKEKSRNYKMIKTLTKIALYNYYDEKVLAVWDDECIDATFKICSFEVFNTEMAKYILGENADELIKKLLDVGCFIVCCDETEYMLNSDVRKYLLRKQKAYLGQEYEVVYEKAGKIYEKRRELEKALKCYKKANNRKKLEEIVIYLSENADGCSFARTSSKYINRIFEEYTELPPKLIGAKAMVFAYEMKIKESEECLNELKNMINEKESINEEALRVYIRTLIARPYVKADDFKKNLIYYFEYAKKNGLNVRNIMPTGNMPSVINGGLDLHDWSKNFKSLYPFMKKLTNIVIGKEAIGVPDIAMGEFMYEQNNLVEAMKYLSRGRNQAKEKGNIRGEWAAVAIMGKVFRAEGELDITREFLNNVEQEVLSEKFYEIIPNIKTAMMLLELYDNNIDMCKSWLTEYAPNEFGKFYISDRYQMIAKIKVYILMEKYMEAVYISNVLLDYALKYHRKYIYVEVKTLKAIIYYKKNGNWKEIMKVVLKKVEEYSLMRVIIDLGISVLPLLKEFKKDEKMMEGISNTYLNKLIRETKKMAKFYPNFLVAEKKYDELTAKEMLVLEYMIKGFNNKEISEKMELNIGTIKYHVGNILKKLEAENRIVAIVKAIRGNLI